MTHLPVIQPQDAEALRHVQQVAEDLHALGITDVRVSRAERMLYATDASIFQVEPVAVVVPENVAQGVAAVRYCAGRGLPLLPRGGGTSLNGQTVNHAVVVDFGAHCRGVQAVDPAARACWVEPGVVNDQLNAHLAGQGLMFAPDPATSSHNTVGGMIGNNSSGAHSILYGRTVENLLGLDVVLSTGTTHRLQEGACVHDPVQRSIAQRMLAVLWPLRRLIRERFPKILRHVDGYNFDIFLNQVDASTPAAGEAVGEEWSRTTFDRVNLAHMVCGSEGTLCTILGAELKLAPVPQHKGLAILGFAGVEDALAGLHAMLATRPAAVELVDDMIIDLARQNAEYRAYVDLMPRTRAGAPGAVMYVEYFGQSADDVTDALAELRRRLPECSMQQYTDATSMARAWLLRKAGEPLLHAIPGVRRPVGFVEDTAVEPGMLPEFIRQFKKILARHGTRASFYAHASVGCLHIRPLLDIRTAEGKDTLLRIGEEVTDLVVRFHGALSGEHGSGRSRTALQQRYFGPEICRALAQVKEIWDPRGIMNPGIKVAVDDERMAVRALRIQPGDSPVTVPPVETFFRYPEEGDSDDREASEEGRASAHADHVGFAHAVERCNGAGMCRRLTGGTMCPSYRALRDERHATRGRGNHLRLAITGQLGAPAPSWNDPAVHDTLRLCLSCKACKSECPSGVDIAKLKAEYQAQKYAATGHVPLEARLMGNVRGTLKLAARAAPLANALGKTRLVRGMLEWLVNIDPRRSLPPVGARLDRWFAARDARAASASSNAPVVVLFADCFALASEPQIGRAAVELLEAFGYRVVLPDTGCCGRPLISTGQLARASHACGSTLRQLQACMTRHRAMALLVLEPSCLSAIKDDWLDLKMTEPKRAGARAGAAIPRADAVALAQRAWLVEEFLEKHWDAHPRRPAAPQAPLDPVMLHGHCHQKALWGVESSAAILRRVFGEALTVLPTGCCGMAGGFGFSADRYDLSMRIGEEALLPALRARAEVDVCAPGASCRHQIHDGAHRCAQHPVELLARVLL